MEKVPDPLPVDTQFPCGSCGASVVFVPGKSVLACPYCGHANEIPQSAENVVEFDFRAELARLSENEEVVERQTVRCQGCNAETTLPPNVTASACAFCGKDVVATTGSHKQIKPKAVLPFAVPQDRARKLFREWVEARWFAPGDLLRFARTESRLAGMYVPYWTYDSDTTAQYTGQRGDAYYVSVPYTTTENGRTVTRMRQERRIRWTWVSGTVRDRFDDVLVLASNSLPPKYTNALEPWDLKELVPYKDDYLSGFRAESYQVDLSQGFEKAQGVMEGRIRSHVCRDIGGDEQRIFGLDVRYDDITFKHLLLPIWISGYAYRGKTYRFLVNGRTGEVQGERPWSFWKIAFLVLGILAVIGIIALIAGR